MVCIRLLFGRRRQGDRRRDADGGERVGCRRGDLGLRRGLG